MIEGGEQESGVKKGVRIRDCSDVQKSSQVSMWRMERMRTEKRKIREMFRNR